MTPLSQGCAPLGAPSAVSRRRIAHVLHRLLDEELDLTLGLRGARRHATRLDLVLAAIVFQLRGSHGTPPAVCSALACDDLRFVPGAMPPALAEDGGQWLVETHLHLSRRLTVLSAVFASANQHFLAGFFRTLRSEHRDLEAETRGLGGLWRSENDDQVELRT